MTRLEPDGGGGAVGINPQLLQSMISTMNSSAGDALNLVTGYISQLSRVGLDTSSLTPKVVPSLAGVTQISAGNEYSLAVHQVVRVFVPGGVPGTLRR